MVESAVYIYFWSETERASYFTKFSVICSFWSLSRFSASIYSKCHSETCSYLISKYSVAALETFKIRGFWYSTNCSTNIKSKVVLKEIEVYQDSILNRRRIEKWRRRKDSIASTPNCLTSPGINDKGLHHTPTNKQTNISHSPRLWTLHVLQMFVSCGFVDSRATCLCEVALSFLLTWIIPALSK